MGSYSAVGYHKNKDVLNRLAKHRFREAERRLSKRFHGEAEASSRTFRPNKH